MEIIIGTIPPLIPERQRLVVKKSPVIDAQLLNIRPPRKGVAGPSGRERRNEKVSDPRKGRVMTIMVPDASLVPADIDSAKYDVSIRLVRRVKQQ